MNKPPRPAATDRRDFRLDVRGGHRRCGHDRRPRPHPAEPVGRWIHLVTLGVLSNGIFQWSWYFTRALAHLAPDDPARGARHTVAHHGV